VTVAVCAISADAPVKNRNSITILRKDFMID
jgi:hypothetical protein